MARRDIGPGAAQHAPRGQKRGHDGAVKTGKNDRKPGRKPAWKGGRKPENGTEKTLIIEPRSDWYNVSPAQAVAVVEAVPSALLERFHEHAVRLLENEATAYTASRAKSSSYSFMTTIMNSGTWSDKVSALTLAVQESPIHTVKLLDQLVSLAGKHSRSQALLALGAVKDLLAQGNVLPDRKLRAFVKQPELLHALQGLPADETPTGGLPKSLTRAQLMSWAYEDKLKRAYFEVLKILETWCNDEIDYARARALTLVYELLRDKPEQEENLLRLLVNKLGDTSKKIASRASYLLLQLQNSHPAMKPVIVTAIESDVLLRPGQSSLAKYYAVITLNQTILQASDPETANKLLGVYFGVFTTLLNLSQRQHQLEQADKAGKGKSPATAANSTAVKGAAKPAKPSKPTTDNSHRSDDELREKITAQVLTGINRAYPFSQRDGDVFDKHLETLFRITHSSNFNTSVQALYLIQQMSVAHAASMDRFMRTLYGSLLDLRLVTSSKQTLYLNLLYRSLKADASVRRVKAFVKRLVQVLTLHDAPFVCAALYLVIELRKLFPSIAGMISTAEMHDDQDGGDAPGTATDAPRLAAGPIAAGPIAAYDARKREPEFSNADRTCLWDLTPWLRHHHPSVALFAAHLLAPAAKATPLPAKPDPQTHTLSHFLDRFAYRNAKAQGDGGLRGQSIMQPALAGTASADTLLVAGKRRDDGAGAHLNSEAFWARRADEVREDEVFFHQYFAIANSGRKKSKKSGDADADEAEDGADRFDEDEVWQAIVGSKGGEDIEPGDDDSEALSDDDGGAEFAKLMESDGESDGDESDGGAGVELGEGLDGLEGLLAGEDGVDDMDEDDDELQLDGDSDDESPFASSDDQDTAKGPPAAMTDGEVAAAIAAEAASRRSEGEGKGGKGGKAAGAAADAATATTTPKAKRRRLRGLPIFADAASVAAALGGASSDEDN